MVFLLIFLLSLSSSFAEVNYIGNEDLTDQEAVNILRKLDFNKNTKPHKLEEGSYQTKFGLQFDKSCMEMINSKKDPKHALNRALVTVKDSISKIAKCSKKYPELNAWISEWAHSLRKQIVYCEEKDMDIVGGEYMAYSKMKNDTTFRKDYFEAIISPTFGSEINGKVELGVASSVVGGLIHEVFHSTKLNNLKKHGDIERISLTRTRNVNGLVAGNCSTDVTQDRVSVVQALCTDENLNSTKSSVQDALYTRMSGCPESKSCVKVFSSKITGEAYANYPSSSLSKNQSRLLCARIKDEGYCNTITLKEAHKLYRIEPNVSKIRDKVALRLHKIIPKFHNHIPRSWIKSNPSFEGQYLKLKENKCFSKYIFEPPNGEVFIKVTNKKDKMKYTLGMLSLFKAGDLLDTQVSTEKCDRFKNDLKIFISKVKGYYFTSRAAVLVKKAYKDSVLSKFNNSTIHFTIGREDNLSSLFGKKLLRDYMNIIQKFDPASADYDCSKIGHGKLFFAAELTRQGLTKEAYQKVCR